MKNFSNRSFIRSITPQDSSSQTFILLGISVAGLSVVAIALFYRYRQQTELLYSLRKQNLILTEKLEASKLAAAIPEIIRNDEELSQQTDN
ncbi:hypothetical protein [Lacibacter sediminis]|uniref:Uncharacterized protein n=1 Tax=Lacibacter sediminis TaxID=2760713 RepID=A0A7G5XLV7_9BACT|nr:hypothetical protein [Lacibacter sediminis]QNA46460.1 hypothetical protein H4075_09895 [Lacibacter sediminis]